MPVAAVFLLIDDVPVELIEPEDEGGDLGGGNEIALAGSRLPIQHPGAGLLGEDHRRRGQGKDERTGEHGAREP